MCEGRQQPGPEPYVDAMREPPWAAGRLSVQRKCPSQSCARCCVTGGVVGVRDVLMRRGIPHGWRLCLRFAVGQAG